MRKIVILAVAFIIVFSEIQALNQFIPTNGPTSTYAMNFVYDSTSETIFINTLDGIYKLKNDASAWEPAFPALSKTSYPDYFFMLLYADSLYFCRYSVGAGDQVWGSGLFVSSDKGISWQDLNVYADVYDLIKVGDRYLRAGDDTIKASTDNGKTWYASYAGISDTSIYPWHNFEQILKINQSGKEYVLTRSYDMGVYISSDSGRTWSKFLLNLPKDTTYGRITYSAMTATQKGDVWISCDDGIFVTSDLGKTWGKRISSLEKWSDYALENLKADHDNNLYGMGYGVRLISKNANDTNWSFYNYGLSTSDISDIYRDYKRNVYYAASSDGIFRSTDSMKKWHLFVDGFNKRQTIKKVIVAKNLELLCGSLNGTLFKSSDKGNNWSSIDCDFCPNFFKDIFADENGNVYFISSEDSLYFSSDNGINWKPVTTIVEQHNFGNIVFDKAGDIFVKTDYKDSTCTWVNSVLISSDNGNSWEKRDYTAKYFTIIAADKSGNLLAASDNSIFRSSDKGITWILAYQDSSYIGASDFHITNDNVIFLATRFRSIFRSTDGGITWKNLSDWFGTNGDLSCISSPGITGKIVAGTVDNGYFISFDNGDSWTHFDFKSGGMTDVQFYNLVYDGNGTMYASTFDGVYKCSDITDAGYETGSNDNLLVYPNPATGNIINIKLNTPANQNYSYKLLNIYGTIVDRGEIQAGETVAKIQLSGLINGCYVLVLTGENLKSEVFKVNIAR